MAIKPKVKIYTDGACKGNPGPGGWAAVIIFEGKEEQRLCGGAADTTNNRMELMAVINALNALKGPHIVELYSDSQYIVNAFTKNWLRSWKRNGWARSQGPLANKDLWQTLDKITQKHSIAWNWVKGHNGNTYNEICDTLATGQASKYEQGIPSGEDEPAFDIEEDNEPAANDFDYFDECEADYGQELIAMPAPTECDADEPECLKDMELSEEDKEYNREECAFLKKILNEHIMETGKALYDMDKPCGVYEYCDYCNSKNLYPCAEAYARWKRQEEAQHE